MANDIEKITGQCHVCLRFRANNQKEPLIQRDVPQLPWQGAAVDIMTFKGRDYLVAVDCYSKYPEIALLENKTAACVINHLKSMFARHGIAEELLSDNMPFASTEFVDFAREWKVGLTTSSPNFPQSNGQSERAVQNMKNILKKADYEGRDPYLALLEYRNTPITLQITSKIEPARTTDSRRSTPTSTASSHTHKHYYDRGSKQLSELQPGSVVRVRQHDVCEPAVVVRKEGHPRSYIINREGREYRRNRRHILETSEKRPEVAPSIDVPPDTSQLYDRVQSERQCVDAQSSVSEQPPTPPPPAAEASVARTTARGRVIKTPLRFAEYQC